MAVANTRRKALPASDLFQGPDHLANAVLIARRQSPEEAAHFGDISTGGLRQLIRNAYYASQAPNEGRYPLVTLLVPARDRNVHPLVSIDDELSVSSLCRIGPTLGSHNHALLVCEQGKALRITGIASLKGLLTEMSLGDPISIPSGRPDGLTVQITGPGEVRAGERRMHRIQAGCLQQEASFVYEKWFGEWCEEAAAEMFKAKPGSSPAASGWHLRPGFAIVTLWLRLLRKAADLRQGSCFVILPDPQQAPIRHTFSTTGCDLGTTLVECCEAVRESKSSRQTILRPEDVRRRLLLRERLLSTVDAVAHLSATDGCVVFNRRLELHSIGSMIEVPQSTIAPIPCFIGQSATPLDEARYRSFGARRKSAVQLCQACPGAIAFVISQDGDLRIFVRQGDEVRLYDNAAYW